MDRPPRGGLKRTGVHVDSLSRESRLWPPPKGVTYFHFVPPSLPPSLPVRLQLKFFNDSWIRARPRDRYSIIYTVLWITISAVSQWEPMRWVK